MLGVDWLKTAAAERGVPLLSANLVCDDVAPFQSYRVVERSGLRLGFVGILGEDLEVDDCVVGETIPAVQSAVSEMGSVDALVVLAHQSAASDHALAEAIPEIDLVVNGHEGRTRSQASPLPGDALQLTAGSRGKKIGIADIVLAPGAAGFQMAGADTVTERLERYRERLAAAEVSMEAAEGDAAQRRALQRRDYYIKEIEEAEAELAAVSAATAAPMHSLSLTLKSLSRDVADHPKIEELLAEALAEIEEMESARAAMDAPRTGPYVGSAVCQGCHMSEYAQWEQTPHAMAWETLVEEGRTLDQDCFQCHVTGAFHPEGPELPTQVGHLQAVGCEACHGPGQEHVRGPAVGQMTRNPPVENCIQCHDGMRDEGRFDDATYRPQVVHRPAG